MTVAHGRHCFEQLPFLLCGVSTVSLAAFAGFSAPEGRDELHGKTAAVKQLFLSVVSLHGLE